MVVSAPSTLGFYSMTTNLSYSRTILPKEVMCFPDFPYDSAVEASFISREQVVKYVNSYAEHYNLKRFIKVKSINLFGIII